MKLKNVLSVISIVILGGLMTMSLSACGLNKDSRAWIEKNRVSDIYKVYPTKNPEDLFKVFPDGFDINQYYTTPDGVLYQLELEGKDKTKEIKGQFIKEPYADDKKEKLSDVTVENGQIIFSDGTPKQDWPVDGFLFQQLALNQTYLDGLKEKKYSFNWETGDFSIVYYLEDLRITKLFHKKVKSFEISGFGKDYYFRSLVFTFDDGSEFIEQISKPYN
ncbi:hypothetical protein [Streptococcus ferus]|uniref:hypothetical protein n=1 Tax=Streptococcus ferus TaxID=1345 RepID=UPI00235337CA|nr:hypothetical protein [Streptococcus ferus]